MVLSMDCVRIAAARKCWTIKELLNKAHISSVTAQRIKNGKAVSVKTAGKLAAVLECDVTELLADCQGKPDRPRNKEIIAVYANRQQKGGRV